MVNYTLLTDIVKHLYKLKSSTIHVNQSDGLAKMYWGIREHFNSFSLNISGPKAMYAGKVHVEYNVYEFKYNRMSYTESGVSFTEQCSLEVCFSSTSYFANLIDKHSNTIQFNSDLNEVIAVSISDENYVFLKDDQFNEGWLFQLQTLYDIPYYEDMLALKNVQKFLQDQCIRMSFKLKYNPEYVDNFLQEILEYFNGTVGTDITEHSQ